MHIKIRKFHVGDAKKVSDIIAEGWFSLISKHYSQAIVENQIEENSPVKFIEKSKKVRYFVAEDENKILGVGGYSKEKIQTFFVSPKNHKKGIGSAIMKMVLAEAKKDGIHSLDCWSTFCAERFYASFGFDRKKIITVGHPEAISFVLMTKKL